MVTTLYLVRHGVTVGGEERRYKGSIDVPLSEEGMVQAQKTAGFIAEELARRAIHSEKDGHSASKLQAVYSSPLIRAQRTAEKICEPHGLAPVLHPDLRERHFGVWEGMSFTEIKEHYPEEFGAWARNPLDHAPREGETTREVETRAVRALSMILQRHKGHSLAIVAHGGLNRVMLCHIMGLPLEHIFRIEQDNAAVSIIEFWEAYPVVKLLNYSPAKYEENH
ncbi:MAG TPA: histidine phosphatase family protein [Dissulfurispiraceae bacterium]|nr:histidine phosphatase family protein [Dissulfurispiraceae bacterium]